MLTSLIRGSCTPRPPVFPVELGPLREGWRESRQFWILVLLGLGVRLTTTKALNLKANPEPPEALVGGYAVVLIVLGEPRFQGEMPGVWTASGSTPLGQGIGSPQTPRWVPRRAEYAWL